MIDVKPLRIKKKIQSVVESQLYWQRLGIFANIRHLKIISLLEQNRRCESMTKRELKFFNLKPSTSKMLVYEKQVLQAC